jgi:hypothetical protein
MILEAHPISFSTLANLVCAILTVERRVRSSILERSLKHLFASSKILDHQAKHFTVLHASQLT